MTDQALAFLQNSAGAVVQLRIARELLTSQPADEIEHLQAKVCHTPQAIRWLERLQPRAGFGSLHGSKPECFENAAGKLVTLGLRAGCPELDHRMAYFREQISLPAGSADITAAFCRSLMASFLLMAGYTDPPILAEVRRRLERVAAFARPGWTDIYIDSSPFHDIPQAFRKRRLVNPDLYPDGDSFYPLIYDLHAFAAFWPIATAEEREQITTVAAYILLPEYQQIEDGYGIMRSGPHRYYSIGWDCKLPGFMGIDSSQINGAFIQRLVLMSAFPLSRQYPWFQESLHYLQQFATGHGTWIFPRTYLPEKPTGYWVGGYYLGLEENRRTTGALEVESTFWMAKLLNPAG